MGNIQKYLTKKNLYFVAIFGVVGFIALQIPVAQLAGSKVKFTIYDAFAPMAGAFIGSIPGLAAVFLMQFSNFLVHGARIEDAGTIIRFFPMLFAVLYFAKKGIQEPGSYSRVPEFLRDASQLTAGKCSRTAP